MNDEGLAVPRPMLQVSDQEQKAIAEQLASLDRYKEQVHREHEQPRQLALTLTQEPTPEPTLLEKALDVERAKIDAEQQTILDDFAKSQA